MRTRNTTRAALALSALLFVPLDMVSAAEVHPVNGGGQPASGGATGDLWGVAANDSNLLVWEREPEASEYSIMRSEDNGAFTEAFRLPNSRVSDFDVSNVTKPTTFCYRVTALDGRGKPIRQYRELCLGRSTSTAAANSIQCTRVCPVPYPTIDSMCLSDEDFVAPTLSEAEIESLFAAYGSFLQGTITDVDGTPINPAHLIFTAAQTYQINPKVLLATMDKESRAISVLKTRPTGRGGNELLRCIMGYNVPNCTSATGGATIREQIDRAAWQFRKDLTFLNEGKPLLGGWQVGVTTQSDPPHENLSVTPATKAVATLFSYTNVVGHWWCGEAAGGNSLFCCTWAQLFNVLGPPPPSLAVSLTATPNSGPAPLNGVTLQANVTGTPNETINYTFYCDRPDQGTNITQPWDYKKDTVLRTQMRASGICDYLYKNPGIYTAKVIVEQGNGAVEKRVQVTVGGSPSGCFP